MAEEKKSASKSTKKAAKPAAAAKAAPEAQAAAGAAPAGETCRAEKCKQAVRAKGYCRKHYIAWRRGAVGTHHRYKICSKEACRKPRVKGGLCEEHAQGPAGGGAKAEGAPPAAAQP